MPFWPSQDSMIGHHPWHLKGEGNAALALLCEGKGGPTTAVLFRMLFEESPLVNANVRAVVCWKRLHFLLYFVFVLRRKAFYILSLARICEKVWSKFVFQDTPF